MTIRIIDAAFESVSEGDYDTVEEAYRAGVLAGLDIAAGEVANGTQSSIVQIAIDHAGQSNVARGAVSVSTARLLNGSSD